MGGDEGRGRVRGVELGLEELEPGKMLEVVEKRVRFVGRGCDVEAPIIQEGKIGLARAVDDGYAVCLGEGDREV